MKLKLTELRVLYDLGFALHWLHPKSKRPKGQHWQQGPRKTWEELKSTYKKGDNVGVRTGKPSKLSDGTYLVVLDIDVKSGSEDDAKEAYQLAANFIGVETVDHCPWVRSGSGGHGRHLLARSRQPQATFNLTRSERILGFGDDHEGKPAFEVDVFGSGKQTVLPSSLHPDSGLAYSWGRFPENLETLPIIDDEKFLRESKELKVTEWKGFEEVNLRKLKVQERVINLIEHLDGLDQYGSDRSAALYGVLYALVGHGLTDNQIVSVIIDPDNALSEVVLSRVGRNDQKAAQWILPQVAKIRAGQAPEKFFDNGEKISDWQDYDDPEFCKKSGEEAFNITNGWRSELDKTERGLIKITAKNTSLHLRHELGAAEWLGYNLLTDRVEFLANPPWDVNAKKRKYIGRGLDDHDYISAKMSLARRFKFEPTTNLTFEAVDYEAKQNSFHPIRDWLKELVWDGTPRVDTWLIDYLGAKPNDLNRAIGRKVLCAAIHRVMYPGCKFDHVVVLEGDQGIGKSTLLRELAGKWFCDSLGDVTNKDVIGQIQGSWIVEISELSSLDRASTNAMKEFISKQTDKARMAYERKAQEYPRQCIFIGTTNDDEYLKDPTGNRRYWPVEVSGADFEQMALDHYQIWAEAFSIWKQKKTTLYMHTKELKNAVEKLQNLKLLSDPWEDTISTFLAADRVANGETSPIKMPDLYTLSLGRLGTNMTRVDQLRLGGILRKLGYKKSKGRHGVHWVRIEGLTKPYEATHEPKEGLT